MLLPKFEYHRPTELSEALEVLGEFGAQASVLAGGTDLLVNMKHGKVSFAHLISLDGLESLGGIAASDGKLTIGPLMTASALAASADLGGAGRSLALGAGALGSPQVRNRATLGGNVCTARPAADMCVGLLAVGAEAILAGPEGQRRVNLEEFFSGPGQTVKAPGEILAGLVIERPAPGSGGGYQKLGLRKSLEIALVNVGATLALAADGKTVEKARVSLGAVAPTPILSPGAAAALVGQTAGDKAFAAAAKAAASDARPISDHRGSAEYRREVVEVLTRRALKEAWQAARGQ